MASPADSREVKGAEGRPVCGAREPGALEDKSSRFGLCRADCMLGEPGSFFTLIVGGAPGRGAL